MQRITAGINREIWRESIPLDGGASVVVTTGIHANSVSVPQVFGILALESVVGLPLITAVPSSSNGRLIVTITNTAAVGNAAAWQLDVTLNHSIQQGRDAAGVGAIYVIGPNGQADWLLNQVRYFFIDPDGGDDSHIGYIDAAPGTVFTPVQAAAVAVKTTNRLEGLVPRFGAGRGYIILAKPRAGRAIYDAAVAGDKQGTFRRDLRFGYSLEIMRGSDLTNSAADRAQLGAATHAGPFTVAFVGADAYGPYLRTTAPVGVLPEDMGRYRLRAVTGAGTFYAACSWGDNPVAPAPVDPTVIRVWATTWGPLSPGDTVYLEEPGVRLRNYSEAVVEASQPSTPYQTNRMVLVGVEIGADDTGINGNVYIGANVGGGGMNHAVSYDTPSPPLYHFVRSYSPPRIIGSLISTYYWVDEAGQVVTNFGGPGLDVAGCLTTQQVDTIDIQFSRLDNSNTITASRISISSSFVRLMNTISGAEGMNLIGLLYCKVIVQPKTLCRFQDSFWLPDLYSAVNDGLLVYPDPGAVFSNYISNLRSFWGVEPARHGIELAYGQYKTTFAIDSVVVGNGVFLQCDQAGGNANITLTYPSLQITGLDVEGGQKIVCERSGQGYASNVLPCPRGVIMRMIDGVAGTTYPTGLVVSAPAATPSRFALALSDSSANMRVVGALLTNVVQGDAGTEGGYGVVGYDGIMVLRQEGGSANPVSGDELYLSASNPGYVTKARPQAPFMYVARAAPIGPNTTTAGDIVPAAWDPELPNLPT